MNTLVILRKRREGRGGGGKGRERDSIMENSIIRKSGLQEGRLL